MKLNQFDLFKSSLRSFGIAACLSALVLLFFFQIPLGEAGFYSYKDENGKTHYTDDLSKIPLEYRESDKKLRKHKEAPKDTSTISVPSANTPATIPAVEVPGRIASGSEIQIPLTPAGNNFLVDVVLNGTVTASLILDTGAALVDISTEVAQELGFIPASIAAKKTFSTANGTVDHPIIALDTVKVGNAQSMLVESSINDSFEGFDGLLGMAFLGDYRFEIDRKNKVLILKPEAEGEMEWGGKTGSWWKKRFDSCNESIRNYSRGAKQALRNRDPRSTSYKNLAEFYKTVKMKLENQARVAGVPDRFK